MTEFGIALVVVGAVLLVFAIVTRRRSAERPAAVAGTSPAAEKAADIDVSRPRPKLAEFHVRGDEAQVTFDVPLAAGGVGGVLQDLLLHEAIEVVREKQHTLPIDGVTHVVAFAGRGEVVEVGRVELPQRGELPPPVMETPLHHLAHGFDPIDQQFEHEAAAPPEVVARTEERDLGPIGRELRIPSAIEAGLRTQGIDPASMDSTEMVRGMLSMFGYVVAERSADTYSATKAGTTTFIRNVGHAPGDYQELDDREVRRFMVDFLESRADRGLLVTDKYCPFSVYERERKEPRVRFVTRERLQKFVDSLSLS